MLSQVAVEALYSATYVETYLDSTENLPDDVQRYLSRIREIDVQYRAHLREVDNLYDVWSNCPTSELEATNPQATKRSRAMSKMQKCLIAAQELGDEKLQIVTQLQELIDHKTRQLDHDFKNLDYGKDEPMLELKEARAGTASPPMTSPINTTNIAQQIITQVTSPNPAVSTLVALNTSGGVGGSGSAGAAASIGVSSAERVTSSTVSSAGSTAISNTERGTKRARRTRTETNSASGSTGSCGGNGNGGSTAQDVNNSDSNINSDSPAGKSTVGQSTTGSQKKGAAAAAGNSGKKKKRKTRGATGSNNTSQSGGTGNQNTSRDARDDTPPIEEPIDPDEPTYCLCDQISFGEMILCDNDLCPIEWFHFSCVSLMTKPKGKWFCPNCRGDRPNVMKPKQQFLKELERYNKEKEEKT